MPMVSDLRESPLSASSPACPLTSTLRTCGRRSGHASVAAGPGGRGLEAPRALVAEEVVPAEDVVHLEAFGAGIPLAYVALQERLVADHGAPLLVAQERLARGTLAGLAGGGHGFGLS